ncbi:hypothetical protein ACWKSP_40675 [Micromonosporaceae bacterium Da 78-11]
MQESVRDRLRAALPTAMKARDRVAVAALRATIAAIDNAEAVKPAGGTEGGQAIEQVAIGAGATEVERLVLTETDFEAIIRREIAERETAAADYDRVGHPDRASQLRAEVEVLTAHL